MEEEVIKIMMKIKMKIQ